MEKIGVIFALNVDVEDEVVSSTISECNDEELKELLMISENFVARSTLHIWGEMWYKLPHFTDKDRIWAGEYCGRCGAKSRSYEGGKCYCNTEVKSLEEKLDLIRTEFIQRQTRDTVNIPDEKITELLNEIIVRKKEISSIDDNLDKE